MANNRFLVIFLILGGLCNISRGQVVNFNTIVDSLYSAVLAHNGQYILNTVDTLLPKVRQDKNQQYLLSTFKVEALVDMEKYTAGKILANQLLKNEDLPLKLKVRLWIQQSLINEILKNFQESLAYLELVTDFYRTHKKDYYYGVLLYRKSSMYRVSHHPDSAFEYAKLAREFGKVNGYKEVSATAHMLLGFIYYPNDFDKSLENYLEAKKEFGELGSYMHVATICSNIFTLYFKHNQLKKAKQSLLEALNTHKYIAKDSI